MALQGGAFLEKRNAVLVATLTDRRGLSCVAPVDAGDAAAFFAPPPRRAFAFGGDGGVHIDRRAVAEDLALDLCACGAERAPSRRRARPAAHAEEQRDRCCQFPSATVALSLDDQAAVVPAV